MNQKNKSRRASKQGRPQFLPRSFREWIWPALVFSTLAFVLIIAVFLTCTFGTSTDLRNVMLIIYINFLLLANNIISIAGYKKLRRQRKIASKKVVFTLLMIYQWGLQTAGLFFAILFFSNKLFFSLG